MPHVDRTAEFKTVSKSFQVLSCDHTRSKGLFQMKIHAQNGRINNSTDRSKIIQSSIQFNQLAKWVSFSCFFYRFRRIGRDLSITCAKMEKLTELAKKKSLFDDRAGEVDELSTIIKQVCYVGSLWDHELSNLGYPRTEFADRQPPECH